MAKVGVIGIGNIGLNVISQLLQEGHDVIGVSRNPDAAATKYQEHMGKFVASDAEGGNQMLNFTSNYKDLQGRDYIISTASRDVPQGTKDRNIFLYSSDISVATARKLQGNIAPHAKVLVITNPVEWQASLFDKELPDNDVLGVGTIVDTLRQEKWCNIVVHSWINFIAANLIRDGDQEAATKLRKDFLEKPFYNIFAPVIGLHQDNYQVCLPPEFRYPDEHSPCIDKYADLLLRFEGDLFNENDERYSSILGKLVSEQGTNIMKTRQRQGIHPPWDCQTPAQAAVSIVNACESPEPQKFVATKKLSLEEICNVYLLPQQRAKAIVGPDGSQFLGVVVDTMPELRTATKTVAGSGRGTPLTIDYEYTALQHGPRQDAKERNAVRLLHKNLEIAYAGLQILGLDYQAVR